MTAPADPSRVSVDLIDDASATEWDEFVDALETTSAYHRYVWRRIVRKVFGHQTYYLAARAGTGRIVGVLPLVRLKSLLFGDFMVSLPYFNYGGLAAHAPEAATALLDAATALAQRIGSKHVELRQQHTLVQGWPVKTDKVCMLLTLPATTEELWKRLPSKLRSQVRRPAREGAQTVFGGLDLLDDFYGVFAENMRDLGTPVYSMRFFREILTSLPEEATIAVVRIGAQPVAAGLTIEHRGVVEIPWASSLRRMNALGVNMHLYWSILERAVTRGARVFDFGRSTVDSGTFRFKQQWGAEPAQCYWHYWLRDGGELPQLRPDNPKFRAAVAAWRKLPLGIANWIGPHLVRNLP